MILLKYIADCSRMNLEKEYDDKEAYDRFYSRRGPIPGVNESFCSMYEVDKKFYIVVSDVIKNRMTLVVAYQYDTDIAVVDACISEKLPDIILMRQEEITIEEFEKELVRASRTGWIEKSSNSIMRDLQLSIECENYSFFEGPSYKIQEKIYSAQKLNRKQSEAHLSQILASNSFYEEIRRIYSKENERRFLGHPVHYLISAGDKAAATDMIDVLVPALLKNQRLVSGRVCEVTDIKPKSYRDEGFHRVFLASRGGTVVINLSGEADCGMYATGYHELAEKLGQYLGDYGNECLFIFVDVSGKRAISNDTIAAILTNADMVQINEGHGNLRKASQYLKRLADQTEYGDYRIDELTQYLPQDKDLYSVSDIFTAYHKWYGRGLKTHIYKAYKEKDIMQIELKKKTDKPYVELQKMIGLTDVKRMTDEILAVAKMQKMRKEMGLSDTKASMHMLFSGNPGTAKTTVARLLAQILKEEDVITNGHIVECGRQDLVGKYVGWTAQIVEEKFRAARGGILFIDEAYSLVEDGRTYGAEAINTIVQQMENYREETIVIFAGYTDKMKEFLEQNEGLASRIAFHLDFPDYSAEELACILDLMLEKQGYRFDEETRQKCLLLCEQARRNPNFGNGRFVRNLLEHAIMRQADRLIRRNSLGEVTKEAAGILYADDFEMIGMKPEQKRTIGFSAETSTS